MKDNLVFGTIGIFGVAVIAGLILVGDAVSAEVLESSEIGAAVTVTEACTMSGTGMNTHTAEVANGTYTPDIGSTTINVVCNDNSGFAIYATGFTGDVVAETNSNKLVGTSVSGNSTIVTGTATSAGNPDISNWAMKLTASSGTGVNYPLTISTGYNAYHEVPNTWTKVAARTAGTDVGTNAEGSTMTTTYAAYISKTQAADSYTGKVKFTLVHPNDAPAPEIPISMQNMAISDCGGESPREVVDSRDGESYKVQVLADGNCWMLDNLRLDPTAVSLTDLQGKTNASNQTLTYFKNGGGSSPYTNVGVNTTWASSSDDKYDEPKVVTAYKDTTTTSYGAGSGKIGVYYNFCAASAGSYCYLSSSSTGNATEDLCPAGWRMPTGGSSGEYKALYTAYNSNAIAFKQALSTPLSGYFSSGSADDQGDYGYFWSSTRNNNNVMRGLYVDDSSVGPTGNYYRNSGISVRCVLK